MYGPHTLAAYIDRTNALLPLLRDDAPGRDSNSSDTGPLPPDNSDKSIGLNTGVLFDTTPKSRSFGDVILNIGKNQFMRGETVKATFVGANPRNNLRLEETYAAVEHRHPGELEWKTVRDDSDWALVYQWKRTSLFKGTSEATVAWDIEDWAKPGEYRLRYFGDARFIDGEVTAFEGKSAAFTVT